MNALVARRRSDTELEAELQRVIALTRHWSGNFNAVADELAESVRVIKQLQQEEHDDQQ